MRFRVLAIASGGVGVLVATPLLIAMGFVVANEDETKLPDPSTAIEGVIVSPSNARFEIGAPFVYGRVRSYATYRTSRRRGGWGSVSYVDEDRGDPRVQLRTDGGRIEEVVLSDPMNTWRNARPVSVSYESPAEMPGWRPSWRSPDRVREYAHYVLAVRTGERLLVDRANGDVWIGGREAGESSVARHSDDKRTFSIASFVLGGLCAMTSVVLLALGARSRRS